MFASYGIMPNGVMVTVAASGGEAGAGAGAGDGDGGDTAADGAVDDGEPGVDEPQPAIIRTVISASAYPPGNRISGTVRVVSRNRRQMKRAGTQAGSFADTVPIDADLRGDLHVIDDAFDALGATRDSHRLVHFSFALDVAGQRHDVIIGVDVDLER